MKHLEWFYNTLHNKYIFSWVRMTGDTYEEIYFTAACSPCKISCFTFTNTRIIQVLPLKCLMLFVSHIGFFLKSLATIRELISDLILMFLWRPQCKGKNIQNKNKNLLSFIQNKKMTMRIYQSVSVYLVIKEDWEFTKIFLLQLFMYDFPFLIIVWILIFFHIQYIKFLLLSLCVFSCTI